MRLTYKKPVMTSSPSAFSSLNSSSKSNSKSNSKWMLTVIASSILLSACSAIGPNYQRPALDTPQHLIAPPLSAEKNVSSVDWLSWWQSFQDPVLNALLEEAKANNQDVVLAVARIEEARAGSIAARSNRFPSVDANVSGSKSRLSENTGQVPAGANLVNKYLHADVSISYEVDFWGKFSRADEAAKARLLAQEANRGIVQNTLYSQLAQTYFAMRANDAQMILASQVLQTRKDNLRLQQKRFASGSIGELDLHLATSEVAASEITVAQAKQVLENSESALAVLLGRSPAAIVKPSIVRGHGIDALYQKLSVPSELPSDLLNQRPDLIAAEQNLVAANADVGQAKALYFPSLTLTSNIGYESNVLKELSNPASLIWNAAAGLTQPIFRAGAIGAAVDGAQARKTQALAQYVKTVQNAFREVHDAVVDARANKEIYDANVKRSIALKDSLRLAQLRYDNGYSSYLEVLSAQRDLSQAQAGLIETQRAHLTAVSNVYKAVGGGWKSN